MSAESSGRKRPLGVVALSSLLVSLGGATVGVVILTMASDMAFLASRSGYKVQGILLGMAAASFSAAGFGMLLWEGREDGRRACLVSFSLMAALSAWQAVVAFQATPVAFALVCVASIAYLMMPASRAWCAAVVGPQAQPTRLQTVA